MTGEKDRYSTVEKFWKLDDEQLTTPKHDELVLSATPEVILSQCYKIVKYMQNPDQWYWKYYTIPYLKSDFERIKDKITATYCIQNNIAVRKKEQYGLESYFFSEYPEYQLKIKEYYDELCLNSERCSVAHQQFCKWVLGIGVNDISKCCDIIHEQPILGRNSFIIGYWDIVLTLTENKSFIYKFDGFDYTISPIRFGLPTIFIEVKPFVDSYGKVLRQIRTYQEYIPRGDYEEHNNKRFHVVCLYTPDLKFKSAFESQGIQVISP